MKAILLAGGKGTRLRPLTIHTPKPIVPIFDRAFLHYQIDLLRQVPEIDEVILSLNYQPRRIEEIFGDGTGTGVKLRYVVEPAPLGTGGAIRYASQGVTDTIVVFNGDVMTSRRRQRRRPDAPRAAGEGHHRADAGGQSVGVRPRGNQRRRQRPPVPREAESRRDHLRHDQRRHLRPRARRRSTAFPRTSRIRSSAATSRRSSNGRRRSSPTWTAATGLTSARRRNTSRSTTTCSTAGSPAGSSPRPIDRGRSSRPRRASRTTSRSRARRSSTPART